jgi:nitrogen fixation protein NifB
MRNESGLPTRYRHAAHPCFNPQAAATHGRIHLAVAPKCNVQCNYCDRGYDCVNESRPGLASRVLTSSEALEQLAAATRSSDCIRVVGIAGPGDPLFNEATFETARYVKERFPHLLLCLSSNGFLLPSRMAALKESGVSHISVTVNAVCPTVGEKIYSHVITESGERVAGYRAASMLLANQLEGIRAAVAAGFLVKINSILIPGINDAHMVEIARTVGKLGVFSMNITDLIPCFKFAHLSPASREIKLKIRGDCAQYVAQLSHCRQCRADAVGLLCSSN